MALLYNYECLNLSDGMLTMCFTLLMNLDHIGASLSDGMLTMCLTLLMNLNHIEASLSALFLSVLEGIIPFKYSSSFFHLMHLSRKPKGTSLILRWYPM